MSNGLTVTAVQDSNIYPTDIEITKEEMKALNIACDSLWGFMTYAVYLSTNPVSGMERKLIDFLSSSILQYQVKKCIFDTSCQGPHAFRQGLVVPPKGRWQAHLT